MSYCARFLTLSIKDQFLQSDLPDLEYMFLCKDNFVMEYSRQDDVDHLANTLKKVSQLYIDYTGVDYCRLKLLWNYEQRYVDGLMPDFVTKH